jgi:hypothetical protein
VHLERGETSMQSALIKQVLRFAQDDNFKLVRSASDVQSQDDNLDLVKARRQVHIGMTILN